MYRSSFTLPRVLAVSLATFTFMAHAALDKSDTKFLTEAAGGGMFEVQAGRLAVDKGQDPEVKSFGQMLVTDHSAANDQLKSLAAAKGVALPPELPKDLQKKIAELQGKSGTDFDKEFMKEVGIDAHKKDIKLFDKDGRKAKDGDVQAFASKTLPTLKEHLEHAEKIRKDKNL